MREITEPKQIPKRAPNAKKIEQVAQLRALLESSKGAILTDYRGLTVSEITDLRRRLQLVGAEYHVVKNTLFSIACSDAEAPLRDHLAGPIAVAFAPEEPAAAAKAIFDFIRDKRKSDVKVGYIDGVIYDSEGVRRLSQLPPRNVLLAEILGAIEAPISDFVGTLQGILNDFVWTLQAVQDQKAGAAS